MIAVLWANDGFYFLTYSAGEVRDPTRNLPRALTFGLLTVIAIYLTVNLAYLVALPMSELAKHVARRRARRDRARRHRQARRSSHSRSCVSTFGCNAAAILASSRLLYAMAADGLFFSRGRASAPAISQPARRDSRHHGLVVAAGALRHLRAALHVRRVHVGAVQPVRRPRALSASASSAPRPRGRIACGAIRSCRDFSCSARCSWSPTHS